MTARRLATALLIAAALASAGCGGDGEEDRVAASVQSFAVGSDPANCKDLETTAFLEQTTRSFGRAALEACEREAEEGRSATDGARVTRVEVNGSTATADALFRGGSFDGQALRIELVEDDGVWKLNRIVDILRLDRPKLVAALARRLRVGAGTFDERQVECAVRKMRSASKADLEAVVLSPWPGPLLLLLRQCV